MDEIIAVYPYMPHPERQVHQQHLNRLYAKATETIQRRAAINATFADRMQEYVAWFLERHGNCLATRQEAEQNADKCMKAAQKTVALCAEFDGDAESAIEWILEPQGKEHARLLAACVAVAKMEAGV